MESILCWGNPESQFARLGISPRLAFDGRTDIDGRISVWECSPEELAALSAEPDTEEVETYWWDAQACWRYATGANIGMCNGPVWINGQELIGGYSEARAEYDAEDAAEAMECGDDPPAPSVPEFDTLLEYFCDEIGASSERNVAAVAAEMARENRITMGELFTRCQPNTSVAEAA